MRKNQTIFGLSLLALVGVMAVSASAAQAKWLILLNEKSVTSINLAIETLPGEILVPGLGLGFNCAAGSGKVTATLSEESKKLSGSKEVTFTGCKVLGNEKNCTVEGPGKETIVAKASGVASMKAGSNDVISVLASANFATIKISGALCPLNELEAAANGTAILTLLNPVKEEVVQLADLDEVSLFYGEEPATLHPSGVEAGGIEAHVRDADDLAAKWSITLVGL